GVRQYGLFALVVALVALVDKFVSVDVGPQIIAFASQYSRSDRASTASIVQFGFACQLGGSVVGLGLVGILSIVVGSHFAGDRGPLLVLLYGATLLFSSVDVPSSATLRLIGRFRTLSLLTCFREATRIVFV